MNERIKKLTELTLKGEMYAQSAAFEFDKEDLFLTKQKTVFVENTGFLCL